MKEGEMGRLNENKISNYGICWTSGFFFVVVVAPLPLLASPSTLSNFSLTRENNLTCKSDKKEENGEEGVKRVASATS